MSAAVLLDITSIQRLVFATNKLKDNEGASYLVEKFYAEALAKTFEKLEWRKGEQYVEGYVGGGNALYFISDADTASRFIECLTLHTMVGYPGIQLASAVENLPGITALNAIASLSGDRFKDLMNALHRRIKINRNRATPLALPLGQAITAFDATTGTPAETLENRSPDEIEQRVSADTALKLEYMRQHRDGKKGRFNRILHALDPEMSYPVEFEHFRYDQEGQSHIAVIHIDGNSMGNRFMAASSLADLKALSVSVEKATEAAFTDMLRWLLADSTKKKLIEIFGDDYPARKEVPIIPIIMGGDDITFVTDALMGLALSIVFIRSFAQQTASDGESLSSCAGIAIAKTKYPFYRLVRLAEELTKSAKSETRDASRANTSWLDYHVSYGGMSGDIETIRTDGYRSPMGNLLNGPYLVHAEPDITNSHKDRHIDKLMDGIQHFKAQSRGEAPIWPRSIIKALRSVLSGGAGQLTAFLQDAAFRKRSFPDGGVITRCEDLWGKRGDEMSCPYFDMIELMEFLPFRREDLNLAEAENGP